MPRKLPPDITFEAVEDEVHFTWAALKADPDAADLITETDDWFEIIDTARAADRDARAALAETDAQRVVANTRLDASCVRFADELDLAVGKNRESNRWLMFFSVAVNRFIRQALSTQVQKVKGWLERSSDPVLANHRDDLTMWSSIADDAVVKTRGAALVRGEAWQKREEMAGSLTSKRDGLAELLAARARERGLSRTWPTCLYRVERRGGSDEEETPPEPPKPAPQG